MSALAKKYEAMSLRERGFVVLALLALLIAVWDTYLMEPLRRTRTGLEAELSTASASGVTATSADISDPRQAAIKRAGELQTQIAVLDGQLKTGARGFVSADRMIEVLHDVLDRQGRLELVSIRNLPVTSLVSPADAEANGNAGSDPSATPDASAANASDAAMAPQPPYVHSIELVVDGQYSDVLDYLGQLEALPWKFRWRSLELSTAGYPRNRVRIELSTLSLDATWLGV